MDWQVSNHPDDAPRVHTEPEPWRPRRVAVVMRPRADTSQASALILLPLLPLVLSMMSVLFAGGWSLTTVAAWAVVGSIVQYLFARRDYYVLRDRGFGDRTPAVLALASAALYLWFRARSCDGHDETAWLTAKFAIASTITSIVGLAIGTWFAAAMAGVFESVS